MKIVHCAKIAYFNNYLLQLYIDYVMIIPERNKSTAPEGGKQEGKKTMEEKVLVYRLYINGECVGTYGEGPAARRMAMFAMGDWFAAGYTAEQCEVRHEEL